MTSATEERMHALRMKLQRRGDGDLAAALRDDGLYERLPEKRKAALDAVLLGTGFLVNGVRVNPMNVEVVVDQKGFS